MLPSVLLQLFALLLAVNLVLSYEDDYLDDMSVMRPEGFTSEKELENYLKDLKAYYAVLSRPRFGRSVESQVSSGNVHRISKARRDVFSVLSLQNHLKKYPNHRTLSETQPSYV